MSCDDTRRLISPIEDNVVSDEGCYQSGENIVSRNAIEPQTTAPPQDRCFLVSIIFLFFGIELMLPWSILINSRQFYMYKLRNLTLNESDFNNPDHQTQMQIMFMSYLNLAACIPALVFTFIDAALTKPFSSRSRLGSALIVIFTMNVVLLALTQINTDGDQNTYFIVMMACVSVMSGASAVQQGSLLGMVALYPAKYVQTTMSGVGIGTLIASVTYVLTLTLNLDPAPTAEVFFAIGVVFMALTLAGFWLLPHLKFAKYVQVHEVTITISEDDSNVNSSLESSTNQLTDHLVLKYSSKLRLVLKVNWRYCLCIFLLTLVTYSCYPVVNSAVYSTLPHSTWTDVYFTPVTCFVLFTVSDVIGRLAASWLHWPGEGGAALPLVSTLRVVFVPLFMLCNVQPRYHLPVVFHSDWMPILFLIVFAFSNGHLSTLTIMYSTRHASRELVDISGAVMNITITSALALSAFLALGLIQAV